MTTGQEKFPEATGPAAGDGRRHSHDGLSESQWETVFAVHQRLIEDMDAPAIEKLPADEAREIVEKAARAMMREIAPAVVGVERDLLISHVADEVLGLGPIEGMVCDPSISEGRVTAVDNIEHER